MHTRFICDLRHDSLPTPWISICASLVIDWHKTCWLSKDNLLRVSYQDHMNNGAQVCTLPWNRFAVYLVYTAYIHFIILLTTRVGSGAASQYSPTMMSPYFFIRYYYMPKTEIL